MKLASKLMQTRLYPVTARGLGRLTARCLPLCAIVRNVWSFWVFVYRVRALITKRKIQFGICPLGSPLLRFPACVYFKPPWHRPWPRVTVEEVNGHGWLTPNSLTLYLLFSLFYRYPLLSPFVACVLPSPNKRILYCIVLYGRLYGVCW